MYKMALLNVVKYKISFLPFKKQFSFFTFFLNFYGISRNIIWDTKFFKSKI